MNRLPQRVSLVEQTASVLREQIHGGRWLGTLPGEHALAAQLHVGRKTLRAALSRLEKEGLLQCAHGLPRRIITRGRKRVQRQERRVVLLMPGALHSLNPFVVFLIDKLREHLAGEGCLLETFASRAVYRSRGATSLEELSKSLHPAGWVLVHSTEPMQQWFAARQIPCVVVGSRYEGVKLSSVDMDYGAVCTHAVSQFVSRGHKRLALINPRRAAAGDFHTVTGFLAAAAREGITSEVVRHDGTVSGICNQIELLRSRPDPPTALLISRANHFLTVMTFLLGAGARIPRDMALISRENDPALESVVPQVARYSQNPNAFAANASRMVTQMIRGSARTEECKIMPNFIRGETAG